MSGEMPSPVYGVELASSPSALAWLADHAERREAAGLRRRLSPRGIGDAGTVLDLASNDYLGLAFSPDVVAAAVEATRIWGAGSTGSRLVTGSTELHAELEAALAGHVGTEAGLVFSSGYLANLGAISALVAPGDLVVSDAGNHASVVDACRLSRARVEVVAHRDVDAVERALSGRTEERAVVAVDAIFSVDGDLSPLPQLLAVCRRHRAALVVDEAHALGVLGEAGRGAVSSAGLAGSPDVVITATLSKALGSQGGAVLGSQQVIDHLVDGARTFIFDTGLAPACAGAALAALTVLRREPHRASAVRRRASELASAAADLGLPASTPDAAITSVRVGAPRTALAAAQHCARLGVWVGCFRPPSVPDGISRLRLAARADLSDSDLERAKAALAEAVPKPAD